MPAGAIEKGSHMSAETNLPSIAAMPSEEERAIRESVARIASKYGPSYYLAKARDKEPLTELIKELGEAGFIGINLPEEYGGGGLGMEALSIVIEELAQHGLNVTLLTFSSGVSAPIIKEFGTEAQKAEWLPRLISGEAYFSFGITEPDAGSNTHNIKTTAKKVGDKFIVNGQKYWSTGLDRAAKYLIVARTGTDEKSGRGKLTLLLADNNAPGLTYHAIPALTYYPENSFQVFMDNLEVPEDRVLGEVDKGLKPLFVGLNPERICVASIAIGLGRYMLDKAARYANERSVWGVPIGTHQGLAHPLAEAKIQLETAALMVRKAAVLHDHDPALAGDAANMAKFAAANAAIACADIAITVHGGNAVALEYEIMPYLLQIRLMKNAPVSREMILNYVAQNMLGLPKSY
jgi:alkylation response protein AidB-like acyl-CoA dehydrogenase